MFSGSKTWTESDAACAVTMQALRGNPPIPPTQAVLRWAQDSINQLRNITKQYQRDNAIITNFDPQ